MARFFKSGEPKNKLILKENISKLGMLSVNFIDGVLKGWTVEKELEPP